MQIKTVDQNTKKAHAEFGINRTAENIRSKSDTKETDSDKWWEKGRGVILHSTRGRLAAEITAEIVERTVGMI